jgi:peptidoglycan/LPS O-acetylase OafA/YrhL
MVQLGATRIESVPTATAADAVQKAPTGNLPKTIRRHELDWLRTFAVLGLIPFHAAIVFTTGSADYVKNGQTSLAMDVLASFITYWGIQLLFFIGGAAAFFALHRRTSRQYVSERVNRLAIPFIFGVLSVVPLQIYIGYLAAPGTHMPFLQFYATFLQRWLGVLHGIVPSNGDDWVGHLWFIPPLLLFSLLALPFFRLCRHIPKQALQRAQELCSDWRMLLVFGMPLALGELLLHAQLPGSLALNYQFSETWAQFYSFLLFFFYGYVVYSSDRLIRAARRYTWLALGLGTACWLVVSGLMQAHLTPASDYSLGYASFMFLRSYISWLWVIGITGLAIRYLSFGNRILDYLNQGTYPIYVLHMPVLTFVAIFVVSWDTSILPKFLAIIAFTMAATLLLYDLLVRRIGVLRFLFGLSAQQSSASGRRHVVHCTYPGPVYKLVGPEERAVSVNDDRD